MSFPEVTAADWRAKVEKELGGASFDKALVQETPEGIAVAPLYTAAPAASDEARETRERVFRICMRHDDQERGEDALTADVAGGAEALWLRLDDEVTGVLSQPALAGTFLVLDVSGSGGVGEEAALERRLGELRDANANAGRGFALNFDPVARRARGEAPVATLERDLATLAHVARAVDARFAGSTAAMVSSLAYHEAGADDADELAIVLATGVRVLEALLAGGLSAEAAGRQIALQVAVGRDTFFELAKLRALRTCWRKVLSAAGVASPPRTLVHAVCSTRTLTLRDPWVNMLRVTTQMFAAILGGADLVTPASFDQASGAPSDHGRRVARNTGLVLREESYLGRVTDPAGGSYYLETITDALAREAWERFRALEREGGIAAALESGRLRARLDAAWHARLAQIAKRRIPILGVSEFANLGEKLPRQGARASAGGAEALPTRREAAAFEALRERAAKREPMPEAVLVTLGSLAESRARAGFAAGFFAAGGIATRESTQADVKAEIACLCGTDERYAEEAAGRARALKAAGCGRVLLAGRPGALEKTLREAGVDGFVFVGCDVVGTLSELLGAGPGDEGKVAS